MTFRTCYIHNLFWSEVLFPGVPHMLNMIPVALLSTSPSATNAFQLYSNIKYVSITKRAITKTQNTLPGKRYVSTMVNTGCLCTEHTHMLISACPNSTITFVPLSTEPGLVPEHTGYDSIHSHHKPSATSGKHYVSTLIITWISLLSANLTAERGQASGNTMAKV